MTGMTLEEIINGGLGDCDVLGINWEPNGENVCIDLLRAAAPSVNRPEERFRLRFVWAYELDISLKWRERWMGCPFTWEVRFQPLAPDGHQVELDFGGTPDGFIRLKCSAVELA